MQLTKKDILSNTTLFIKILAFIIIFAAIFGDENILIGVATITAMLMLLERDLTSHPVVNTSKFIALNLFIGLGAFLADLNIWFAIPINFSVMFVISYSLIFNLKNPLYLPFSLQYLFLLAMPVSATLLPLRLLCLVVGAISIMALQMLRNKNRMTKNGDQVIKSIFNSLVEKAQLIQTEDVFEDVDKQVVSKISELRNIIYDKREENYYLTEEGSLKLNISISLEKINILLDDINLKETKQPILDDLIQCIPLASDGFTDKKALDAFEQAFDNILAKYKKEKNHSLVVLRMLNNISFLKNNIASLKALGKQRYNVVKRLEKIPLKFKKVTISITPNHTNSMKLSYAFRMGIGISLSGFIVDFFEISEGRWMMFTVLSVIIPIYEQSTKKMRDRIFATIIGGILVAGLFMIFQGNIARTILVLIAGYLMSYIHVYRYSTILVTFSAIGSVALIANTPEILTFNRIALVIGGIIQALFINKFIFPYKFTDANTNLSEIHSHTISEMLLEAIFQLKGLGRDSVMKNLLIISNMVEDRLKLNIQGEISKEEINWLKDQRRIASTIYELYEWIGEHGISIVNLPELSSRINLVLNHSNSGELLNESIIEMKDRIITMDRIEDRMVESMILEITEGIASSKVVVK